MKFLIAGGGICGLTTAYGLHQLGIEVEVFEASPTIESAGAGISLSCNAIRALKAVGLGETVISKSQQQKGGQFFTPQGNLLNASDFHFLYEKFGVPGMISMHRADLHHILLEALKNKVPVSINKRIQRVVQQEEKVIVHFSDGSQEMGDYLLACDGIHSVIRKQLLPASTPRYAGYTIWRGLVYHSPDELTVTMPFKTWGKNGQFGGVPMTNNRVYWFASIPAKQKDPKMKAITIADLKERFAHYHEPIPQILALSKEEDLLLNDAIDLKPLTQFAFGNILLMGDAAHAMTPNLGQGACQAIEDAAIITHLLKSKNTPQEAFAAFEQQRIPRMQKVTNDSWNVGKIAHISNPLLISMRNFYMRLTSTTTFRKQIDFLNAIEF